MADSYRNEEINDLLEVWEWCSRRLHVKWQRKRRLRNGCFMGIACALSGKTSLGPMELIENYKSLRKPILNRDKVLTFWEAKPVSLLELSLGSYTKVSPLTEPLDQLRLKHQNNPTLDELAKKMRSREKRFGSEWYSQGYHPEREFRLLKKQMEPLCDRIRDLIAKEHAIVEKLALEVLAQGWQFGQMPVSSFVRKTPELLLNRATRLKLWSAAQETLADDLDDEKLEEALWGILRRKITPSLKLSIDSQGYSVDQVVDDFISFDMRKSRKQITG